MTKMGTVVALLVVSLSAAYADTWTKILMSQEQFPEAKCLDGSPGHHLD